MKNNVLSIEKLNLSYIVDNTKFPALKDITFCLYENELVSIIGESGSGKTTLVKYIMGLNRDITDVDVSSYNLYNERIDLATEKLKTLYGNTISMVMQDSIMALNPTLKIGDQLKIMIKEKYQNTNKNFLKEKYKQIFEEVKIDNYNTILKKYPAELSGGMNQRVNIALNLIKEPKILIMDEPTSSVDADNRLNIVNLIKGIQKRRRLSVIFITHDILLAKEIADRIIVMKEGKKIEEVSKKEGAFLFNEDYSKKLISNSVLNCFFEDKKCEETIIEMNKVNKSFNDNVVLDNFNMFLNRNETLGIVGKSGSGKTTICKIIMGIYKPNGGNINFEKGISIEMVYQNASTALNPSQTIYKILNEENIIKKKNNFSKEEIKSYLNDFNLPVDVLERKSNELSGGQKQIISIIRALLNKPNVIILDEPTSSLDVSSQKILLDLLKQVKDKYNLTYILISHDLQVINYMCNRCIEI